MTNRTQKDERQMEANGVAYFAGLDAAGTANPHRAAAEFSTKPEFADLDRAWLIDQWCATLDGHEPGEPQGFGKTEAEAVRDLADRIEERE